MIDEHNFLDHVVLYLWQQRENTKMCCISPALFAKLSKRKNDRQPIVAPPPPLPQKYTPQTSPSVQKQDPIKTPIKPKKTSFTLSEPRKEKFDTSLTLEQLKQNIPDIPFKQTVGFKKRKLFALFIVSYQEMDEHAELIKKIQHGISTHLVPCEVVLLEEIESYVSIILEGITLIMGTKGTLRQFPNIKTLYKQGYVGKTPLVFAPEFEIFPQYKKKFWEEVKQCTLKFC